MPLHKFTEKDWPLSARIDGGLVEEIQGVVNNHQCSQLEALAQPLIDASNSINKGRTDLGLNLTSDIQIAMESLTKFGRSCSVNCTEGHEGCPLVGLTPAQVLHNGLPEGIQR